MALNGRVLLLNQTYEPLGTVSVARAIIMTFKNTVFVEEFDGGRVLRSAHDEWPVPSGVRPGRCLKGGGSTCSWTCTMIVQSWTECNVKDGLRSLIFGFRTVTYKDRSPKT